MRLSLPSPGRKVPQAGDQSPPLAVVDVVRSKRGRGGASPASRCLVPALQMSETAQKGPTPCAPLCGTCTSPHSQPSFNPLSTRGPSEKAVASQNLFTRPVRLLCKVCRTRVEFIRRVRTSGRGAAGAEAEWRHPSASVFHSVAAACVPSCGTVVGPVGWGQSSSTDACLTQSAGMPHSPPNLSDFLKSPTVDSHHRFKTSSAKHRRLLLWPCQVLSSRPVNPIYQISLHPKNFAGIGPLPFLFGTNLKPSSQEPRCQRLVYRYKYRQW